MFNSKYKWHLCNENGVETEEELINVLLKNRNVNDANQFFNQENFFYDPFLFNDMHKTVERIKLAINKKEKIMLYGDYDVDGVTGTAILYKTLTRLKADVSYYIPNRFTEGYGPNLERFKTFVEEGYNLIITIDNGITGNEEGKYLKEHGVDFIITDHHECKEDIPIAYSIVHPKIPNENYPFKDLSGCGVALKVAHALIGELPIELVDLASLGTYADIVSAIDENRSILKMGLKLLQQSKHMGIRALIEISKVKVIDEFALGFIFGPRLNAPGRMVSANEAVKLLVTEDFEEAINIANSIEKINKDRKSTIDTIIDEAIEIIENNNYHNDNVIVIAKEDWHEGVLGIAANKLVELYSKPVIILTENDNVYKGSCRTLADFPLFENLNKCSELLHKFGGHTMAAGLQIEKNKLDVFRKKLHDLAGTDLCNIITIDCIPSSKIINNQLTSRLEAFRPFGPNNEKPLFLLKDFEIVNISQMGNKSNHLRLTLKKDEFMITAVGFQKGDIYHRLNEQDIIDVVGTFELNEYNGRITNQFLIKDLKCHMVQIFDYRSRQFNPNLLSNLDFIYFENDYGHQNAILYQENFSSKNIVLIDLPDKLEHLVHLMNKSKVENLYLLLRCDDLFSSEHLLTREKMGKLYQTLKKYQKIKLNHERFQNELMVLGFDKKLQNIAIQVFFELNFVIIESDEIIVVENPDKRQLSESKTYNQVNETIKLKEKLLLSSTKELKEFIVNLSMEDKNEY